MIGVIDEKHDWVATSIALQYAKAHQQDISGIIGQDSRSFLAGHKAGFLEGFRQGQHTAQRSALTAYRTELSTHLP